ncbi:MAG: hypothetical protein JOZ73_07015 [Solirubrobacterales bacterium]|nr:hypothetical protein [Solirubrobacterales bacterium]
MFLLENPPPEEDTTPPPGTIEEAQKQADEAQEHAAQLAADADTAIAALAIYLAAENLADADTIITAIGTANNNLKEHSADAKSASEKCQQTTTLDGAARDAWEEALSARDAAQRESEAINLSIAQAKRAPVVAQLDKAAKILIATITTITAALTAAGFAAGDFTFFYRNHLFWALVYLILAAIAIFVGTFAFLVDSVEKRWKLRAEQIAIYLGVAAFGVAFIIAVWGLAAGASGGLDRPVLSADLTGSQAAGTTVITAKANRSAVPRSNTLVTSVWGVPAHGSGFVSLRYDVVGASSDGTVSDSVDVPVHSGAYGSFVVTAAVESPPQRALSAPPSNCLPSGTSGGAPVDPGLACAILTP